ncbi:hypothetical protein GCM10025331_78100 [Actinoplanes utahensis]|nr:hypothetical protein Aut01nite_80940 [Actinoplanes utahensis]
MRGAGRARIRGLPGRLTLRSGRVWAYNGKVLIVKSPGAALGGLCLVGILVMGAGTGIRRM